MPRLSRNAIVAPLFVLGLGATACGDDDTSTTAGETDGTGSSSTTTSTTVSTSLTGATTTATTTTTMGTTTDGSTGTTDDTTGTGDTGSTGGGVMCGDNMAEGMEVCDGTDLLGEDCASQGFLDGTLGCAMDCMAFDTAMCNPILCPNGAIDPGEDCDGMDLGGETCMTQGFASGTLACDAMCMFDTTLCVPITCPNGMIDPGEDCDGMDLGGETCMSQGFASGTLACDAMCMFDTSMCVPVCVDDGLEENDDAANAAAITLPFSMAGLQICGDDDDFYSFAAADGDNIGILATFIDDNGDIDIRLSDPGGNQVAFSTSTSDNEDIFYTVPVGEAGTYVLRVNGFDSAENAYDLDVVAGPPVVPGAGDVVINEIMQNPSVLADGTGEYFELYNPSLTTAYELMGCEIFDLDADLHTIASSVIIPPDGYATFAISATPGFTPDYVYSGMFLGNGADELGLRCNATVVDQVDWDGGPNFPDPTGASMNLDPLFQNTVDNDVGANWCETLLSDLGNGDLGTPGAANDACPLATATEFILGCDPAFCTFTMAAGPNGGDLLAFTIPGINAPFFDDAEGSCFTGGSAPDLLIQLDSTAYTSYTATTCTGSADDSSIAVFDADPTGAGVELACSEDAPGKSPLFCSELDETPFGTPAAPLPTPATNDMWVVVDEWNPGSYWDGATDRLIEIELIP